MATQEPTELGKHDAELSADAAAKLAEEMGEKTPAKQSRRSYSEYQKELIVMADAQGGRKKRLEVASLIGMPCKTADHVIALYKAHGKEALHDSRHDRRTHLGKGAKKDSMLLQLLLEWLHMDAKLTHKQLRDLINLEIFRRIVKSEGLDLAEEESSPNCPITIEHIEKYFSNPAIQEKYKSQHVENENTISHWLDGLIVSRKYLLEDSAVINDEANRTTRLQYSRDLLRALEDDKSLLVFLNEVPFWLSMTHPPGHSADVKLHSHAHAFMGITPAGGIIKSDVFSLENHEQKHGLEHNPKLFKQFLNELLGQLLEAPEHMHGKDVYIIADCPIEYITSVTEHKSLQSVPNWEALRDLLQKTGNEAYLIKMAANSPPLNLGEYYTRRLRNMGNDLLHDMVLNEAKYEEFLNHKKPGEHEKLLEKITRRNMEDLAKEDPDSSAIVRLTDSIRDTISSEGALDFLKTYDHLFGEHHPETTE